jgi:hypothetical protein
MLNNWRSFRNRSVDFRPRMRKPRGRPSTGWRRRGVARKPWVRQWRGQCGHLSVAKENGASFWICLVCRNRHFGPFVYLPSEARCRALRGNRVDEWEAGQQRECCDKFVTRVTESSQKKVFVKCQKLQAECSRWQGPGERARPRAQSHAPRGAFERNFFNHEQNEFSRMGAQRRVVTPG